MIKSKYATNYYDLLKETVPQTYLREDSDLVLARMLYGFSELLGGLRMSIENLTDVTDADKIPECMLKHLAKNFGLQVDLNQMDSQRLFISNAGRWIDRKGTLDSIKSLIDSYGLDADVDEIVDYYPRCGDVYSSVPSGQPTRLICGSGGYLPGTAVRRCGTMIEVDEEDPAFDIDEISEKFRVQLASMPSQEIQDAIERAIDYLKPITSTFRGFTTTS